MEPTKECSNCIFFKGPMCNACNGWTLWYYKNSDNPPPVNKSCSNCCMIGTDLCRTCDIREHTNWTPTLKSHEVPKVNPVDNRQGHPMFYQLLDEIADLHSRKNADYGDGNPFGNFLEAKEFGVTPFMGVLIRMSDKYTRIRTLARQADLTGRVKEESIIDTLKDLAVYALIAVIMLKEGER